ncbi:MAG: twin-arginine translocase TatA/TatE family subunit [Sphingomonadaceae bacterium]
MGSFSIWHWIVVALIVLLLFGRGRISDVMGELAKGITSFRKGLKEDEEKRPEEPPRRIEGGRAVDPAERTPEREDRREP